MRNILIDATGDLVCPHCRWKQFSNRRTRRAKLLAGVASLAVPKRMQCLGCREYMKGPPVPAPAVAAKSAPTPIRRSEGGGAITAWREVVLRLTSPQALGSAIALESAHERARLTLTPEEKTRLGAALEAGESVDLVPLRGFAAQRLESHLRELGFAVEVRPATEVPEVETGVRTDSALSRPVDVVGQLERLAALRAAGALTDDEFAQQKARLLS